MREGGGDGDGDHFVKELYSVMFVLLTWYCYLNQNF